jgi:hypothetical protein
MSNSPFQPTRTDRHSRTAPAAASYDCRINSYPGAASQTSYARRLARTAGARESR